MELMIFLNFNSVNVAELPSMQDKYMRLRDELWFLVREWFESRDVKIIEQWHDQWFTSIPEILERGPDLERLLRPREVRTI